MFSGTKTYEPDKKKGKIEKRLTGEIEEIEARIGGRIKKRTKTTRRESKRKRKKKERKRIN